MPKSLEKWISEALEDPDKEPNPQCTCLTLFHFRGTQGTQAEVHSVKLVAGKAVTAKGLAELFNGKMETDAQHLVGSQQYVLCAFYGSDVPGARFPMTFIGEGGLDYKGMATEGPSTSGQISQGMRLTEKLVNGSFALQSQMFGMMMQHTKALNEELREAREMAQEAVKVIIESAKERVQATHEMRMKEAEYIRSTDERAMLIKLAPAAINQLTGVEIFPQSTEDTNLIEAFCKTMDREKMEMMAMAPGIDKRFLALLNARFEKYEREQNEKREKIAALRPGSVAAELGEASAALVPHANGATAVDTSVEGTIEEPEVH